MSLVRKIKFSLKKLFHFDVNEWDELVESTNLCHSVVENVGVGISVISPDMRVLAANKKMHEWFPKADFGKNPICYKIYNDPARDEICTYCPTVKTLADGSTHEAITSTPSPKGTINFRILSSPIKNALGNVIAAIEVVEDVTANYEIDRVKTLLATVVENADEAIITKALDGKILTWNRGAEKIYGYWAGEAVGKDLSLIIPEGKRAEFEGILKKVRLGESVVSFETERLKKDGSPVYIMLSVAPLKDKDGKIYGAATIARDVTKMKLVEKNLRAKLEDLEKMHALTIGREKRIIELKDKIAELEMQLTKERPVK